MIIATARDAANLLGPLFADAQGEKLVILHLDARRRLICVEEPPAASSTFVRLPLRAIVVGALRRGSAGLVVAHNHPSGDPRPSLADIDATRRIADSAAKFDIRLHDHLVFAGDQCRSFRELGLL